MNESSFLGDIMHKPKVFAKLSEYTQPSREQKRHFNKEISLGLHPIISCTKKEAV